jgi:hypothetical protein
MAEKVISALQRRAFLTPELHCEIAGHEFVHWPEGDIPKEDPEESDECITKRSPETGKLMSIELPTTMIRGRICERCKFSQTAEELWTLARNAINLNPGIPNVPK